MCDCKRLVCQATANKDTKKLRRLLENGIQHSPRGLFDTMPLLQAAQNGRRETICLLLEHGASLSEQDEHQGTALNFASASRHAKAANELHLYVADISPINKKGQTFLYLAVLSKSPEKVAVLLDKGVVISAQDLEGSMAFHLVADRGHRGIIHLLIDHRAEVGLVDKLGQIPLHRSACLGYGAATKLLVDRWSVITAEDYNGRTARDLAEGSVHAIKALNGEELDFYMY